ncbi:ribonuclease III domain-containing protein [Ochromonadaceae sp. CCMP2298]|nr:ribonuclease III domain-containing protein [Ochromonadaceae sp. CCMP2298]
MQLKRPSVCWQATDTLFERLAVCTRRLPVGLKKLADFVEAVIGACFLDAGVQGGISAIKAFGTVAALYTGKGCASASASTSTSATASATASAIAADSCQDIGVKKAPGDATAGEGPPTPPIAGVAGTPSDTVNREYFGIDKLEANLEYTFRNPALLLQAITHSSLASNYHNNERLEFLGDAVLDLVVVAHVFRRSSSFQPEQLHNEKQLHTNNCNLARVAYELNLDPFILHDSHTLDASFAAYSAAIKRQKERAVAVENKTLADTMEAVIGAMFLDCGKNLLSKTSPGR